MKSFISSICVLILLTISCSEGDDIDPNTVDFEHTQTIESSVLSYNSLLNTIYKDDIQEKQINNLLTATYLYRVSLKTSSEKYLSSIIGLQFDLNDVEYGIAKSLSGESRFDDSFKMDKVLASNYTQLLWTEIYSKMQKKQLFIKSNTESEVVLWFSSNHEINKLNYYIEDKTSIDLNMIMYQVNPQEDVFKVGKVTNETFDTEYSWVEIDNQRWTTTDYLVNNKAKVVLFDEEPPKSNYDGEIVLWEELLQQIPDGWHLPSVEEWQVLVNRNSNTSLTRGNHLIWEFNGVNTYGMSLNFSGTTVYPFNNAGDNAFYLTSSKNESGVLLALKIYESGGVGYGPVAYDGLINEIRGGHIRFVQNVN
ncbi:fibrobacter succinogenes major paralogous domain-containing protein [Formosa sp. 3Alg 14/1]|uniref:hypothetical protein n=1 Tax=Formosa sp. 3Alg 14/1 TaxID=3382190 RepID=UPI0039BE08A5